MRKGKKLSNISYIFVGDNVGEQVKFGKVDKQVGIRKLTVISNHKTRQSAKSLASLIFDLVLTCEKVTGKPRRYTFVRRK